MGPLLDKLPASGIEDDHSIDMVVNICGALNNLVTGSSLAARDIAYFDGLPKLMEIKKSSSRSVTDDQTHCSKILQI